MKKNVFLLLLFILNEFSFAQGTSDNFENLVISTVKSLNSQCPIKTDEITTIQNVLLVSKTITFKMVIDNDYIDSVDPDLFKKQMISNLIIALPQPETFSRYLKQNQYQVRYLVYSSSGKLYHNITITGTDLLDNCNRDSKHYETKTTYKIGSVIQINIPTSLEIKDENQIIKKNIINGKSQINLSYIEIPQGKFIFQPAGTNNNDINARKKYARVIIAIEKQEYLNQNAVANATATDIQYLDDTFKKSTGSYFQGNSDFIWYPTTVKKIGNKYAIITKYQRPAAPGGNSPVYVEEYKFFISSKLITITTSYRKSEKAYWENEFLALINSIIIN